MSVEPPQTITNKKLCIVYSKEDLLSFKTAKRAQEWPTNIDNKHLTNGLWDPVKSFEYMTPAAKLDAESIILKGKGQTRDRDMKRKYANEDRDALLQGPHKRAWTATQQSNIHRGAKVFSDDLGTQILNEIQRRPGGNRVLSEHNQTGNAHRVRGTKGTSGNQRSGHLIRNSSLEPDWLSNATDRKGEKMDVHLKSSPMDIDTEKSNLRFQTLFLNRQENPIINAVSQAVRDRDTQLLELIKGTSENRKQRIQEKKTARQVETLLKGILMKKDIAGNEINTENLQLPRGLTNEQVKTVDEIESKGLYSDGNKGAGDMSNFYRIMGLLRSSVDKTQTLTENKQKPATEQVTNVKQPSLAKVTSNTSPLLTDVNSTNNNSVKVSEQSGLMYQTLPPPFVPQQSPNNFHPNLGHSAGVQTQHPMHMQQMQPNVHMDGGYQNYGSPAMRPEQLAMMFQSMNQGQLMNPNNIGPHAFRWYRAMKNAVSANNRINQMQQPDVMVNPGMGPIPAFNQFLPHGSYNVEASRMNAVPVTGTAQQVNNSSPGVPQQMSAMDVESLSMHFTHQLNVFDHSQASRAHAMHTQPQISSSYDASQGLNRMPNLVGMGTPFSVQNQMTAPKQPFQLPYYSGLPTLNKAINPVLVHHLLRMNSMQQQINAAFCPKQDPTSLSASSASGTTNTTISSSSNQCNPPSGQMHVSPNNPSTAPSCVPSAGETGPDQLSRWVNLQNNAAPTAVSALSPSCVTTSLVKDAVVFENSISSSAEETEQPTTVVTNEGDDCATVSDSQAPSTGVIPEVIITSVDNVVSPASADCDGDNNTKADSSDVK